MKTLIVLFTIANLLFKGGNPSAYDMVRKDIKKINDVYAKLPSFSVETYYSVFEEQASLSAMESKTGLFMKRNEEYYIKLDDVETIQLNSKTINILHDEKLIIVGDSKKTELNGLAANIDSLLTLCSDIKIEAVSNTQRKYKLYFSNSTIDEFTEIDITVDFVNSRFTKIVLYYKKAFNLKNDYTAEGKQPRLEISYRNFKPSLSSVNKFNEEEYITPSGNKLKPVSKYSKYQLSDMRFSSKSKK